MEHLTQLVEWANLGFDTTLNQRFRPSLVLIINRDDRVGSIVRKECDVAFATSQLFETMEESEWFESQKQKWRDRGKTIQTSKDLLYCYYDDVKVVVIPSPLILPTHVLFEQYKKLYEIIRERSTAIQAKRNDAGLSSSAEDYAVYMDIALQQMAENFFHPIDIHHIIQQVSRMPTDFHGHITAILTEYASARKLKGATAIQQFSRYLASCIGLRAQDATEGWCNG